MKGTVRPYFFSLCLVLALIPLSAGALPFNDDMVSVQMRAGSIMRPKALGSVAKGTAVNHLEKKEDALSLVNPIKDDPISSANGRRLFMVNCSPCHGDIAQKPYKPGAVAAKFMAPPDITSDFYKQKEDGYLYGTIHFGGLAMMPPLGWKLSPTEHWDIINYIRKLQNTK